MSAQEILELGGLYRETVADLAFARRRYPGDPLVRRLEALVLRARHTVYRERVRGGSLREFITRGYWQTIRARPAILVLAVLAGLVPALLAAAWAVHDPGAAIGLLPSADRAGADPHVRHFPSGLASGAALASSIYTNNIQVSFLTFAGGLLAGVGTLAVLAFNGLLLGALAGLSIQAGTFSVFVRFVAPHGLLELSCFAVAGIAGLRLGQAIIDPGVLPRTEALRRCARDAVTLVLGTAPWLVAAGLIEGFVTPRELPLGAALGLGIALAGVFWALVAVRGGAVADARGRGRAGAAITGARGGTGAALTGGSATSPERRRERSAREVAAGPPR